MVTATDVLFTPEGVTGADVPGVCVLGVVVVPVDALEKSMLVMVIPEAVA